MRLSQNAADVQFIDMRGPSRRRSVSVAGMVEHVENCADVVFCDSPNIKILSNANTSN
jgi:hypothetical protein